MILRDKIYKVFVSSTYKDLKVERQKIRDAIVDMHCLPVTMESWAASNEEQFEFSKQKIDECDYYIVILGGMYGTIAPSEKLSYTEREYDYAVSQGIPVAAFVIEDLDTLPGNRKESSAKRIKLVNCFRQKITANHMWGEWRNAEHLYSCIQRSLEEQINRYPRAGWIPGNQQLQYIGPNEIDYNEVIQLHPKPYIDNPWLDETIDKPSSITWEQLLKALSDVLQQPVTEHSIRDILSEKLKYIEDEDFSMIKMLLVSNKLVETRMIANDEMGAAVVWTWSKAGWDVIGNISKKKPLSREQMDDRTIHFLIENFSTDLMDDYLSKGPEYLDNRVHLSFVIWNEIIEASSFVIYNKELRDVLLDFYTPWKEIIEIGAIHYSPSSNPQLFHFNGYSMDVFKTSEQERVFFQLAERIAKLSVPYKAFISYIKSHYSFDLLTMSNEFARKHVVKK